MGWRCRCAARLDLVLTGTAQTADHIHAIVPGGPATDDRRFAMLRMPRTALAGPLAMQGGFHQRLVRLERGASPGAAVADFLRLLASYGGTGAVPLEERVSDKFLTAEMDQLAVMARILPPAFLGVAAFLLWVTIGRMIATEREQIGLREAFGYRNGEIALHHAGIALVVAELGILVGILGGRWLGRGVTGIYAQFYQFPILVFRSEPTVMLEAAAIGLGAALLGVSGPVRAAMRLAPAAAMRAPAPPRLRGRLARALGRLGRINEPARMLLRQLLRFAARAGLAGLGIARALAHAIATSFNTDAVARMIDISFNRANRQTATIVFAKTRPLSATADLGRLPGVMAQEPFRRAPARLVQGTRSRREALTGMVPDSAIVRPLDSASRPVFIPEHGLVLGQSFAARLDARPGTTIEVKILEGARPRFALPVAAVVETYQGTPAWIRLDTLKRLLLEGPVMTGALALVDRREKARLIASLEEQPMIAAGTLRAAVIAGIERQAAGTLGIFRVWSMGLAAVIVFGVVLTNARLPLSEQARDLAAMLALGYRCAKVAAILVGGALLVTVLALPPGLAPGLLIAGDFSSHMETMPFAVSSRTVGPPALSTPAAAAQPHSRSAAGAAGSNSLPRRRAGNAHGRLPGLRAAARLAVGARRSGGHPPGAGAAPRAPGGGARHRRPGRCRNPRLGPRLRPGAGGLRGLSAGRGTVAADGSRGRRPRPRPAVRRSPACGPPIPAFSTSGEGRRRAPEPRKPRPASQWLPRSCPRRGRGAGSAARARPGGRARPRRLGGRAARCPRPEQG